MCFKVLPIEHFLFQRYIWAPMDCPGEYIYLMQMPSQPQSVHFFIVVVRNIILKSPTRLILHAPYVIYQPPLNACRSGLLSISYSLAGSNKAEGVQASGPASGPRLACA